jgi:hypothetical protein
MTDPRGPIRTIKSITRTVSERLDTYEECEHVGSVTAYMSGKVGDRSRCFACGPYGDPEASARNQAALQNARS